MINICFIWLGHKVHFGSRFFHDQNERKFFVRKKIFFSVTNCYKDSDWGLPGSSKNHQTFCKMDNANYTLKYHFFPLYGHHFDCPGSGSPIRIRIQGSNCNTGTDPHGSGSETLVLPSASDRHTVILMTNQSPGFDLAADPNSGSKLKLWNDFAPFLSSLFVRFKLKIPMN